MQDSTKLHTISVIESIIFAGPMHGVVDDCLVLYIITFALFSRSPPLPVMRVLWLRMRSTLRQTQSLQCAPTMSGILLK